MHMHTRANTHTHTLAMLVEVRYLCVDSDTNTVQLGYFMKIFNDFGID